MSAEDFTSFGWRIPFLLSIILVALALYIRLRLQETPLFSRLKAAGQVVDVAVARQLRQRARTGS